MELYEIYNKFNTKKKIPAGSTEANLMSLQEFERAINYYNAIRNKADKKKRKTVEGFDYSIKDFEINEIGRFNLEHYFKVLYKSEKKNLIVYFDFRSKTIKPTIYNLSWCADAISQKHTDRYEKLFTEIMETNYKLCCGN